MELSVFERLLVLNLTQKYQGDIVDATVVRNGRKLVDFTNEEISNLELHSDEDGRPVWKNNEYNVAKEFDLLPRFHVIIEDILKEKNKKREIITEHVDFYKKFVKDEG